MLPLRAVHAPKKTPFVTRLLIALQVAAFVWVWLWPQSSRALQAMQLRPRCYFNFASCGVNAENAARLLGVPLVASQFLQSSVIALLLNALFLWVFAPEMEAHLGKLRFLTFYFVCGAFGALCEMMAQPHLSTLAIGASGAVSGVLGGYFVLHRRSWILTYIPPIFVLPAPAPIFVLAWFALPLVALFIKLPPFWFNPSATLWAHLGGFALGAAWCWKIQPWRAAR